MSFAGVAAELPATWISLSSRGTTSPSACRGVSILNLFILSRTTSGLLIAIRQSTGGRVHGGHVPMLTGGGEDTLFAWFCPGVEGEGGAQYSLPAARSWWNSRSASSSSSMPEK
jgi:hypothetical protein